VAIVGGLAALGTLKGTSTVSSKKLRQIIVALVLTPAAAFLLSFGIGWLLLSL
jgi:phosphate/sulfate permease